MSKKNAGPKPNWNSLPDWGVLAIGIVVFFAGVFVTNLTVEGYVYEMGWLWWSIILGILLVLAALWDMASPGIAPVWSEGILSFLVFLLPWFTLGAGLQGAHWVAWACGVIGCIFAIWAWASQNTMRQ